jgi:hypothetical protein
VTRNINVRHWSIAHTSIQICLQRASKGQGLEKWIGTMLGDRTRALVGDIPELSCRGVFKIKSQLPVATLKQTSFCMTKTAINIQYVFTVVIP